MSIFGDKKPTAPAPQAGASSASPASPAASRTVLGAGSMLEGLLKGDGEVVIEGVFRGEVDWSGSFVVAPKGRVEAAVKARSVTVEGTISGNVTASERVDVRATGVVEGDITTPRVAVAEGATLRGRVNMTAPPSRGASSAPPAGAAAGKS